MKKRMKTLTVVVATMLFMVSAVSAVFAGETDVPRSVIKENTHVKAIFFGDEKQLHIDEDGDEKMVDTIWIYYDNMTFEQFAKIDNGAMVLYSVGTYAFEEDGNFNYSEDKEAYGKIVINRTEKYQSGEGLVPYESSHTYDLNTLGFSQVVVIDAPDAQAEEGDSSADSSALINLFSTLLSGAGESGDGEGTGEGAAEGTGEGVAEGTGSESLEELGNLFESLMGSSGEEASGNAVATDFDWTITTDNYGFQLPEDAKVAFDTALEGNDGTDYLPLALLQTQVVSGTNYRILCAASNADTQADLVVLTIYQDLEGNASITDTAKFDLNVIYGQLGMSFFEDHSLDDATMTGGWTVPEGEADVKLPETVIQKVETFDQDISSEVKHVPVAILGSTINEDHLNTDAVLCRVYKPDEDIAAGYHMIFMAKDDDGEDRAQYLATLDLNSLLATEDTETE